MTAPPISFGRAVPVLRIFSVEKARELYLGWLGFSTIFELRRHDAPGNRIPFSERSAA